MTLLRRGGGACLAVFMLLTELVANPNSRTFSAPADDLFRAAKKAATGHRIAIPQDEGLKNLTDSGQEIQSFQFATMLAGVTFRVIEEISVEPQPDGSSKLEVFFHKDRGSIPYLESTSYQIREQQLQDQLESKIAALEQEKSKYQTHYEIIHDIDLKSYVAKQKEIVAEELAAKLEEIEQERQAKIADLAGMPTSSFSTMDVVADKFFNLLNKTYGAARRKQPRREISDVLPKTAAPLEIQPYLRRRNWRRLHPASSHYPVLCKEGLGCLTHGDQSGTSNSAKIWKPVKSDLVVIGVVGSFSLLS